MHGANVYLLFRTATVLTPPNAGVVYLTGTTSGYSGAWIGEDIDLGELVECPFVLLDSPQTSCESAVRGVGLPIRCERIRAADTEAAISPTDQDLSDHAVSSANLSETQLRTATERLVLRHD